VRIAQALVDRMIAQAQEELPNECCGMISGRDGEAVEVYPAENTESSPFMYVMQPKEQLRIMDAIDDAGDDLLAIYHSHTKSMAYPSRTDVELAFYSEPLYVIVSLAKREAPEVRAFRLTRTAAPGEQIHEEPIEIT
jgi:[CysO sulfur-carrier protein]-S-L-cysteine hydrolase